MTPGDAAVVLIYYLKLQAIVEKLPADFRSYPVRFGLHAVAFGQQ